MNSRPQPQTQSQPQARAQARAQHQQQPTIEALDITRTFELSGETVTAVKRMSLRVDSGRFIALVGRSGSGKTTLLNLLAGLDHPTTGKVLFEGRDMAQFKEKDFIQLRRHRIGVVFQSFALLPLLSAYENVELPMRIAGLSSGERRRRTRESLEMVGLDRRSRHRPFELSGGEQQRISIARAVALRPDIVLADEPTGELDSSNAKSIFGLFRTMVSEQGMSVVATTHDRTLLDMADLIYTMHDGVLELSESRLS